MKLNNLVWRENVDHRRVNEGGMPILAILEVQSPDGVIREVACLQQIPNSKGEAKPWYAAFGNSKLFPSRDPISNIRQRSTFGTFIGRDLDSNQLKRQAQYDIREMIYFAMQLVHGEDKEDTFNVSWLTPQEAPNIKGLRAAHDAD